MPIIKVIDSDKDKKTNADKKTDADKKTNQETQIEGQKPVSAANAVVNAVSNAASIAQTALSTDNISDITASAMEGVASAAATATASQPALVFSKPASKSEAEFKTISEFSKVLAELNTGKSFKILKDSDKNYAHHPFTKPVVKFIDKDRVQFTPEDFQLFLDFYAAQFFLEGSIKGDGEYYYGKKTPQDHRHTHDCYRRKNIVKNAVFLSDFDIARRMNLQGIVMVINDNTKETTKIQYAENNVTMARNDLKHFLSDYSDLQYKRGYKDGHMLEAERHKNKWANYGGTWP